MLKLIQEVLGYEGYDTAGILNIAVLVSTPHLVALYEEDILDAINYQGTVNPGIYFTLVNGYEGYDQPRASIAGMAGEGWGICSNYTDIDACDQEENLMPPRRVYTVEYTNSSLHLRLQTISVARLDYEPYSEDETITSFNYNCHFTLHGRGSDDPDDYDRYWEEMYNLLSYLPSTTKEKGHITDLLFLSDCDEDQIIGWVLLDVIGDQAYLSTGDALFLAARGSLELAKRFNYRQEHSNQVNSAETRPLRGTQQFMGIT